MTHSRTPVDIAISLGDPAGIGPEIVLKALASAPDLMRRCRVFGGSENLFETARQLQLPLPDHFEAIDHYLPDTRKKDSALAPPSTITLGRESAESGAQAYAAVVGATRAVLSGAAGALVTAPISKYALRLAGYDWPGHTELLAELAGGSPVRMMLANESLRVILVTVHQPLRQAIADVTHERVLQTLQIADRTLHKALGRKPRLWVAGLNPHSGEQGMLGHEETDIIEPAIAAARQEGIDATGPFPPDTVFMQARGLTRCDAVIAMYHDQGLIPVKYLGVDKGVNVTLGLPFVRTSPDHGTAFDIAGKGVARPDSMLAALRLADTWRSLRRGSDD